MFLGREIDAKLLPSLHFQTEGQVLTSDLSGFWGDWQHSSDNLEPSSYTALKVWLFHCSECEINLKEGNIWPKWCTKGHKNLKNKMPAYVTYHCGNPHCGINLAEGDWPRKCARAIPTSD